VRVGRKEITCRSPAVVLLTERFSFSLGVQVGNPLVMEQDPIWRQFLLFCFRNGLFYGDSGDTVPKLRWKPGESQLVRCRPETRAGEDAPGGEADLVVVSTLERSLRAGS
jgi:hypothetical protein